MEARLAEVAKVAEEEEETREAILRAIGEQQKQLKDLEVVMAEIDRHLDVALPLRTELDFSGITFMDSSGIAVILRLLKRMQNLSGSMYVSHVPPQAYRVLEAAGIGRIVAIEQEGGE